jgi:hypothetical protein
VRGNQQRSNHGVATSQSLPLAVAGRLQTANEAGDMNKSHDGANAALVHVRGLKCPVVLVVQGRLSFKHNSTCVLAVGALGLLPQISLQEELMHSNSVSSSILKAANSSMLLSMALSHAALELKLVTGQQKGPVLSNSTVTATQQHVRSQAGLGKFFSSL